MSLLKNDERPTLCADEPTGLRARRYKQSGMLHRMHRQALLVSCVALLLLAQAAGAARRPARAATPPLPPLPQRTEIFVGQGFDTCEVPSVAALEVWFVSSPYRVVNLYIGGAGRYCSNRALNADLVAQLGRIGWRFIPTWVGPQAPCYTGRKPLMSWDPITAYAQGVAEARSAIKVATELGLAGPDGSGTIVYYDLEHYESGNPTCNAPVQAFISGWVGELRAASNLAGVYSNPAALVSFAAGPNAPDAIWPARWLYAAYNPNVTVRDVPDLPAHLWADHQRIWQYAGGHNETWNARDALTWEAAGFGHAETWNGVTLNIDCNVIDGIVATVGSAGPTYTIYLPVAVTADVDTSER